MHDAGIGRDDTEVAERFLAPPQESIALLISGKLEKRVFAESPFGAEGIDLDGMVDHQVCRNERVGKFRVCAEPFKRIAHSRQVYDARNAGKVLQQDASGTELDLLGSGLRIPLCNVLDVARLNGPVVFEAQQVFQQYADRVRQT